MSFATGVPTTLDDFLAALANFASTYAGFTNLGSVTSSSATGSRTIQRLQKGDVAWNFCRNTANTTVQAAMSYTPFAAGFAMTNSGAATGGSNAQQYWTEMNTWAFTGPYTGHYFFTDGTCVHAVLEVSAGIFNHLSFGTISKVGTWTGGEYLTAGWYGTILTSVTPNRYRDAMSTGAGGEKSYCARPFEADDGWSAGTRYGYMRTANTSASADFLRMGLYTGSISDAPIAGFVGAIAAVSQYPWCIYGAILRDSPSTATSRTPLLPGLIRMREGVSGLMRVSGTVPYIAILKMSAEMNPKDIINTDWQVFPITCRTGGDRTLASTSYEYALAYRRV